MVEGQGSLIHPAYSGVTLGLLHGAAPHALVLCHMAGEREIEGYPGHPIIPLRAGRPSRANVVARATRQGGRDRAEHEVARRGRGARGVAATSAETGLTVDDPVRFGPQLLLDAVLTALP